MKNLIIQDSLIDRPTFERVPLVDQMIECLSFYDLGSEEAIKIKKSMQEILCEMSRPVWSVSSKNGINVIQELLKEENK